MTSSSGMKVSSSTIQRLREKGETQRPHSWLPSFTRSTVCTTENTLLFLQSLCSHPQENAQATCSRNLGVDDSDQHAVLVSVGEKAAYCESSSHITTPQPFSQMTAYTLFQRPQITPAVQSGLFAGRVDVSVGQARKSSVFRMEMMLSINLMGVCHGY